MTVTGWWLILLLIAAAEVYALATHTVTLSQVMIGVRNDPIGRWVFWSTFGFLAAHWGQAPKWLGTRPDWRSLVGVLAGLAVAGLETWR